MCTASLFYVTTVKMLLVLNWARRMLFCFPFHADQRVTLRLYDQKHFLTDRKIVVRIFNKVGLVLCDCRKGTTKYMIIKFMEKYHVLERINRPVF